MKNQPVQYHYVLGMYPSRTGVGFAVIENGRRLFDFGIARLYSGNNEEFMQRIEVMVDKYRPDVIAVEKASGTTRSNEVKRRIKAVIAYSTARKIETTRVSREDVRAALALPLRTTKYEVAMTLARLFSDLEGLLGPKRKLWQPKDERLNVFEAVGLATGAGARPAA